MQAPESNPSLVEKSMIAGMEFPKGEVLTSAEAIQSRRSIAERAMLLGNNHKGKVKIIFEDSGGQKQVETTIWSVTEHFILLKTGMSIPLRCIHEIRI
ncbi:MAG TPA: hypothetical protein VNZ86_03180 [Bacteroidia bacterium]|jgi:hypothetical protein|nr:hypothetical protein [Bacteroidia bacterium]